MTLTNGHVLGAVGGSSGHAVGEYWSIVQAESGHSATVAIHSPSGISDLPIRGKVLSSFVRGGLHNYSQAKSSGMSIQTVTMRNEPLLDFYRCPEEFCEFSLAGELSNCTGYFLFGPDLICYGQVSSGSPREKLSDLLYDVQRHAVADQGKVFLPFNPSHVVDNLRLERYSNRVNTSRLDRAGVELMRRVYYSIRPLLPVRIRRYFQKTYLRGWEKKSFPKWPVDSTVEQLLDRLLVLSMKAHGVDSIPFIWFWPDGAKSCALVTHDVETSLGRDFCEQLMDMDDSFGIKSSFQVVPETRYQVTVEFLKRIHTRGFELNVQDLNHDGHLFSNREEFVRRAKSINYYGKEFGAGGFRSAVLYRNVDWLDALDFSYDMSVPNVGHLEPQGGGCCTTMPYFIRNILELPLTTTQDYSLFHVLGDYSIRLWKRQIELILEKYGLISLIVHPDYVIEERAQGTYRALLGYLSDLRSQGKVWITLPREVDRWWRARSQMKLVSEGGKWTIEGAGSERARVAFASLDGDNVRYTIATP